MLTWRELEALCDLQGPLVRWRLGARPTPLGGRAIYMERGVHASFTDRPWPASGGEDPRTTRTRQAAMRTVLERFVRGDAVRLKYDIKELGTKSRNETMRGYFSIRSQGPMTETRLLGFFARHGAFVATAFEPRDRFVTQADWDEQRDRCGETWTRLVGHAPFLTDPWPVETRDHLSTYLRAQDA